MRPTCILVVLLVAGGCDRDFDHPTAAPDAADRDRLDGRLDLADTTARVDWAVCPTTPPSGWKGDKSQCVAVTGWACLSACGTTNRMACFDGTKLVREVRCHSGVCDCWVAGQDPYRCATLYSGRSGCSECKGALADGCCLLER